MLPHPNNNNNDNTELLTQLHRQQLLHQWSRHLEECHRLQSLRPLASPQP
jgi:hypothetical protein